MRFHEAGACLSAGCGPITPLTWHRVLAQWTVDPYMLAVLLMLALGYAVGVRRYRRTTGPWPTGRSLAFAAGLVLFALATLSFIGAYDRALFWVRALQNALLLMTVPLLLACGAPLTLLTETGGRFGRAAMTVIQSRAMKALTFPAVVSAVLLVTPYLLYFTGWYRLTLTNAFFDETLHVQLLAVGFLYFWTRLRIDPVPHPYPHLVSVWISFVEGIGDAGVALLLWLGHTLVAGSYYAALASSSHAALYAPLSAGTQSGLAWNQAIGGGVFWLVGDLTSIPLLGALWHALRREENALADSVDSQVLEVVAIESAPGGGPQQERYRPWWETDPAFAARYGHGSAAHLDAQPDPGRQDDAPAQGPA